MNMKNSTNFNPNEIRKEIAARLLEYATDMRYLCLVCGKDEYTTRKRNFSKMVLCDACSRWIHVHCSKNLRTTPRDLLEKDEFVFVCEWCERFLETREDNPIKNLDPRI
jgi:hypothetical protein